MARTAPLRVLAPAGRHQDGSEHASEGFPMGDGTYMPHALVVAPLLPLDVAQLLGGDAMGGAALGTFGDTVAGELIRSRPGCR